MSSCVKRGNFVLLITTAPILHRGCCRLISKNINYGNAAFVGILDSITRTACFSVIDGDNTRGSVNHPDITNLEARRTIMVADEANKVGIFHDFVVALLP